MTTYKQYKTSLHFNYVGGLYDSGKLEQLTDYFTDISGKIWQFKVNNKWHSIDDYHTLHLYNIDNNKINYQLIVK